MDPQLQRLWRPVCRQCFSKAIRRSRLQYSPYRQVVANASTNSASALHRRSTVDPAAKQISNVPKAVKPETRHVPLNEETQAHLQRAQKLVQSILDHSGIPSEKDVERVFITFEAIARRWIDATEHTDIRGSSENSPTSVLLNLDSSLSKASKTPQPSTDPVDALSNLAYEAITYPPVFITPSILSYYVTIQSILLRPQTIPEIFDLFANKPSPTQPKGSHDVKYTTQNADAPANAIQLPLINRALDTAIAVRSLPLALSIISTSLETPAFRRNKFLRRALPPITVAGAAPLAAYTLAHQMSLMQTYLDPSQFTSMAFAGLFTYVLTVGTLGAVAVTTSNDQMERVTWAIGTPLRERWMSEEQRAAFDRVALAWGHKEKWLWGEEEGTEWESLKEWVGVRGMVLDQSSLLEGME